MKGITATIIEDSLLNGVRTVTYEVRFPRFILPELNTHRVFSRNSASSRARSITRTFAEVMEDPFVPNPFTRNQKGMSGGTIDPALQADCEKYWLASRDAAVLSALDLLVGQTKRRALIGDDVSRYQEVIDAYDMEKDAPSIHKQHVNRLLEPFMFHTTIITSTEWDNYFDLRIAPDAQPEIYELAVEMKRAMDASTPVKRRFHLPYIEGASENPGAFDIKRSAASCASVSYKAPHELGDGAVERIFDTMFADKHMSPFEHVACAPEALEDLGTIMGWEFPEDIRERDLHGNLRQGVVQLRKVLEIMAE